MIQNLFTRYPCLRLVIPLLFGIGCGDHFPHLLPQFPLLVGLTLLFFLLIFAHFAKMPRLFGLTTLCFLTGIGYGSISRHLQRCEESLPAAHRIYRLEVLTPSAEKKKSYAYKVAVTGYYKPEDRQFRSLPQRSICMVYLQKADHASRLRPGDFLIADTHFEAFQSDITFDYAHFMKRRGISGSAYISSAHWKRAGSTPTLSSTLFSVRESLLEHYHKSGLSGDELAVLSAITVGSREELRDELREAYAAAGVSHVLALSGLHIGLLFGLTVFLFRPVWRKWGWLRLPILTGIIALLWLFALLTGNSPSVVRSVLMISLFTVSYLRSGELLSLDTLLTSAFVMLLFKPQWLFEAGFQLSFLSVASIRLLFPILEKYYHPRSRAGKRIWETLCVTTAAQIGTAPLVFYYFHQFPIHFLWTNLLIIPLITLSLYAGLALVLLSWSPSLSSLTASLISFLLNRQHQILHQVESLPLSTITGSIGFDQLFLLYLFIILLFSYLLRPNFRHLSPALLTLCCIIALPSIKRARPMGDSISFYHLRGLSFISYHSGGTQHLFIPPVKDADKKAATEALRRHLAPDRKVRITDLSRDTIGENYYFNRSQGLLSVCGLRIAVVNGRQWQYKTCPKPLNIDFLFIGRRFRGEIEHLAGLFNFRAVILHPALKPAVRAHLIRELRDNLRPYYLPNRKGSCSIML